MSKPRTPSNVLELRGTFKKNPARGRARANEPKGLPPLSRVVPPTLSELEALCWQDIVSTIAPGVAVATDSLFIEYAAKTLAAWRYSETYDPRVGVRWESICGRLGLTPADRSRVSVPAKRAYDPALDEFND